MNSDFFEKFEHAIAAERLDAYRHGDNANPLTATARYLWNIALCESLYSPLQMIEVALRNAIHQTLSERANQENWYEHTSCLMLTQQIDQLNHAMSKLKNDGKQETPGRVVAELNFGFWTIFFNKLHSETGLSALLLKKVFFRVSKYLRTREEMKRRLDKIRILRNRVFHHERIIHWKDIDKQHAMILETIGWISPELEEIVWKLDRFHEIYTMGIDPWKAKILDHWPEDKPEGNK